MTDINEATVHRMAKLVRQIEKGFLMAYVNDSGISEYDAVNEARAIVALLPEPVDPDLLEARELYVVANNLGGDDATFVRKGQMDACDEIQLALAAIKRGRELARQEQTS